MFNKISIFLFSILPISLILGNFAINLNILLVDILALYFCYKTKNWNWIKERLFKLLIVFYIFIVTNSIISFYLLDFSNYAGIIRSIAFIKFVIFAYAFKILILEEIILERIIKFWCLIIGIVIFDIFFESFFGHNIVGHVSLDQTRIVSFFKDEMVVGGLILCFGFILTTYFLNKNLRFGSKFFFNILLFTIPIVILITGERSNFIKSIIIFSFIIFYINQKKLLFDKKKFFLILIIAFISLNFLNEKIYIKQTEFFYRILKIDKDDDYIRGNNFLSKFQNIRYFVHYDVAIKIFKEHPLLGVGNKNFRHECSNVKYFDKNIKLTNLRCSSHPHQVHFELLSEHGLIGYCFFFYLMFFAIRKIFNENIDSKNIFYYSAAIYLIVFLIPLLPSGSFFSTFNGTLFWLIFSIANINKSKFKNSNF